MRSSQPYCDTLNDHEIPTHTKGSVETPVIDHVERPSENRRSPSLPKTVRQVQADRLVQPANFPKKPKLSERMKTFARVKQDSES